ncbi:MAG: glycine cleavage system aminomethyltransferase GcvT [Candidatus Diapherotrites archaeon]|uniref:Probable aminomethyltransferase n=1 Tax=Candidatus Iainarchaeum sp. TaxID=3101447 RepID=A0A938YY61_9ARCH|nr:glycine cleavage system aminomethyltransferase GcvT [Candidatus Diapherotrites archaeon]
MPQKTGLFDQHKSMNAKIIDFYSWQLPLYYSTPLKEHNAVRQACGLFDTGHMGEIQVEGRDAEKLLQLLLIRDISGMKPGQMKLGVMCNAQGGILDDLTVYKFSEEKFWVVVNSAPYERDFGWVQGNARSFEVRVSGLREQTSKLDLQGPKSGLVLERLGADLNELKYYTFSQAEINGIECIASRSGYTGEKGFELYFMGDKAPEMWNAILEAGAEFGIEPCGLASRDTLRLEAAMMLYGQDIDEKHSVLECPYEMLVAWEKQFIGKEALERQRESNIDKKLVGFQLLDRGIARHGHKLLDNGKEIGVVTTGNFSPTLKKSIGLGYIGVEFSKPGSEFEIDIRGKKARAKAVEMPFYRR